MIATIISYPNNEINYSEDLGSTNNSYALVQNLFIDVTEAPTDEYIEVTYNSETITLYITEECRYTPVDVAFINKNGGLEFITFFKARQDNMNVTSEEYENDAYQPNTGTHQYVRYNTQAKSKVKLSSGFVDEDMNENFKQLFLSDFVWFYDGSYTPVNVASKNLSYKTRQNDRLINYEVDFDYAFNEVNNI